MKKIIKKGIASIMSLTMIAGASLGVVANAADQSNEAISPEAINLVNEITANMDSSTFYYTAYDYYDQYSVAPTNHYYGVFVPAGISLSSSFSVYMYINTNVLSNNPTAYSKIIISPEYSSYLTLTSFTSNTYLPNCTQLTPSFARTGSPSLPAPMYSYFLDGIQNKSVINSEYDIHCMTSMYSNYPSSFVYTNKGDQLIKCVYALGDANRDGEITEDDVTCIQKYCLELAEPDPNRTATEAACDFFAFRLAADFNQNGVVDMSDAYAISQYITTHSN